MHVVTITVGRNVGTVPMGAAEWEALEHSIRQALQQYAEDIAAVEYWTEHHVGVGQWGGVAEESLKVALLHDGGTATKTQKAQAERMLRTDLATLAIRHRQDAIALTLGTSELIGGAL